jgi:lysophospholipase L1-like esterase
MTRQTERRRLILPSSPGLDNPAAAYPLDAGTFSCAYSLRKLRSGATAAIRVQRSSDNAQQDIGFIGRELDVASLLSFCGGSNGSIAKWYDQSVDGGGTPNGKDLVQATLAAQPLIVSAGQLLLFPGSNKPALSFDGSRYLVCSSFTLVLPLTHFAVVNSSASNPNSPAGTIAGSTNVAGHLLSFGGSSQQYKFNTGVSITAITAKAGNPYVINATGDYHDSMLEVNPNFTRGQTGTNGIAGLEVGACQGGQFKFFGSIAEYAIYGSISQNRKARITREMDGNYGLSYSSLSTPAYTAAIVAGIDSLTYGQNSTGTTNDWPDKLVSKLGAGTYFLMNTGFPGHTLIDASTRANSESGLKNYFYPPVPVTLYIMAGTNDIIHDGVDAATAYSRLKSYVSGCAGTGKFTNIVVSTLPPSGISSGSFASVIKGYNDLIRAGITGDLLAAGATKIANLQSNGIFDDTPANVTAITGNATYFNTSGGDFTHLTDAGYDAVATILAAA